MPEASIKPTLSRGRPSFAVVAGIGIGLALLGSATGRAELSAPDERGKPPQLQPKTPAKNAMRFELVREGSAETCGTDCREWVSAQGSILPDTGHDFEVFARAHDIAGKVVVLESPGGSVTGGLVLGRAFRRLNMTVVVGHTAIGLPDSSGQRRASYAPKAVCASMCPFVLLGGVRRHVPPEARILVHQIWPGAARADSTAATYSAQNVAGLLRGAALMARYTVDMGGEIELFDLAFRIPPWENSRVLTRSEILRTRLSTTDTPFAEPGADEASVPPGVLPNTGGKPVPLTRWALLGEGASRGIVRRHPLTIYGEEIGTFIVTFACGQNADSLTLRYWETRRLAGTDDVVARALVAFGRDRVPLTMDSSRVSGSRLESKAHATVAASLLAKLIETNQRSLTVATLTKAKVRTVIHVGNTGLRQAVPQLREGCPHS